MSPPTKPAPAIGTRPTTPAATGTPLATSGPTRTRTRAPTPTTPDPDDEDSFAAGAADEYPDFPARPPAATSSPPRSLLRTGHRGLGDWRGGHRSEGGRRGVSIGVIVALVAVVVVVGGVILWRFFGDALSNRSHTAAAALCGGQGHGRRRRRPVDRGPGAAVRRKLQRVGRPGR